MGTSTALTSGALIPVRCLPLPLVAAVDIIGPSIRAHFHASTGLSPLCGFPIQAAGPTSRGSAVYTPKRSGTDCHTDDSDSGYLAGPFSFPLAESVMYLRVR